MTTFTRIVGVRFKRAGKVYYFNPGDLPLVHGDQVVVETSTGLAFGDVVVPPKDVPEDEVVQPIRNVVRKVGRDDYEQLVANRHDERAAYDIALERIASHGLPMRLVNAEYTFDRNRLTFFFTADNRVDFRALVHDLAREFGVRIELRQIGVRDEAKEVGGIGVCGRELCCTSWMGEFSPVSIRMAKQQNLSLNPSKLTGQCGRLKCCLKFENDTYRQVRALLPEPGDLVAVGVPASLVAEEEVAVTSGQPWAVAAGGEANRKLQETRGGTDRGAEGMTAVRVPDPGYVVVQGTVKDVLVTRESVDVDIGQGVRVHVSLKQIESGEAVVLSGKRATHPALTAVEGGAGQAAAGRTDEAGGAGKTERPARVQRTDKTDDVPATAGVAGVAGEGADAAGGATAPSGEGRPAAGSGEGRSAAGSGDGRSAGAGRRRRRPARRRPKRPAEGSP